jgi:hypothetical protein
MLTVPTEAIHKAIALLGVEGVSESEVESGIASFAGDKMVARRLIDWVPEAFGIVLASHIGKINLPATFSARSHNGEWKHFEFKVEPIFIESLRIATDVYHSGDRSIFGNIAKRSSMIDVVNKALNAGDSIDGATLSGPALVGIPAEVYEGKSKSPWQRFLRGSSQA